LYYPTVVRSAKMMLPERLHTMAKGVRQRNLKPPPKLPGELRADLLALYREDILRLEALVDRDLSIWLDGA